MIKQSLKSLPAHSIPRLLLVASLALTTAGCNWVAILSSSGSQQGDADSISGTSSADGRFVAYSSSATNLVGGDVGGFTDIFVNDTLNGSTTRVSVDSAGNAGNADSSSAVISADGRYVVFRSDASNLVANDTNSQPDIFVHDRDTGTTTRVSVDSSGTEGDAASDAPDISADGRYVTFHSLATNLVLGDTNGAQDVFVHDRDTGVTTRVSVDTAGNEGDAASEDPAISDDGRFVTFASSASNLLSPVTATVNFDNGSGTYLAGGITVTAGASGGPLFYNPVENAIGVGTDVFNGALAGSEVLSVNFSNTVNVTDVSFRQWENPVLVTFDRVIFDYSPGGSLTFTDSGQGVVLLDTFSTGGLDIDSFDVHPDTGVTAVYLHSVGFVAAGDNNAAADIFVHDRDTGTTTRVSVDSAGNEANGVSDGPAISGDGRYVSFSSLADNLVAGDTNGAEDVFVYDRDTGTTTRDSVDTGGGEANGSSFAPSLSADGRYLAFASDASDLVASDSNGVTDILVRDRDTGTTTRASADPLDVEGNGLSIRPSLSNDGRYVVFDSLATNLRGTDANGVSDIFIRAVPEVEVTSVSPNMLPIDATTSVTITGTNFKPGSRPFVGGGLLTNLVVVDENTITVDVTVQANKTPGAKNVGVSVYGTGAGIATGAAGFCFGCVTFF